jgi:type II secretory pathway component PulK
MMMNSNSKSAYRTPRRSNERGAALLIALALLALFVMLGTSFLKHMNLEIDRANIGVLETRANKLAEAGVNAAIGELKSALRKGQVNNLLGEAKSYAFPTYKLMNTGGQTEIAPFENRAALANVSIYDESGKVNLNHAPASVLTAVLGIDGKTARDITGSLPRPGTPAGAKHSWMLGVDELSERGLSPEQYDALNRDLITVYTVLDHDHPQDYLNVNAAPAEVLSAVLDISPEKAREILSAKKTSRKLFKDLSALEVAAEKTAATFNVKPDPATPDILPAALSFNSHCFRIVSESSYGIDQAAKGNTLAYAEAIVLFDNDGGHTIVYWNTQRVEEEQKQETAAS